MGSCGGKPLSEFELIDWIASQTASCDRLRLGIGDDCAIYAPAADEDLLTSTDLLIEDIHFKRQWTTLYQLGRKAAAVNISDIAAMGGRPQAVFLAIARPKTLDDGEIKELISGFIYELRQHGAVLAGGDTCASPGPLLLAVTVQGTVAGKQAICRGGAGDGDAIYVSGTLGDSALALQMLQQGRSLPADLAERFHQPAARVELGCRLADQQLATAMLDVSDGLLADLGHMLAASGVGAELELDKIPLSPRFRQALEREPDVLDLALSGGEDYELLFTSPLQDLAGRLGAVPAVTRIGTIVTPPGLRIYRADGEPYQCRREGFDHFA